MWACVLNPNPIHAKRQFLRRFLGNVDYQAIQISIDCCALDFPSYSFRLILLAPAQRIAFHRPPTARVLFWLHDPPISNSLRCNLSCSPAWAVQTPLPWQGTM